MRPLTHLVLILAVVAALCFATSVQAQQMRGQRGPQITPEEAQAAWTLEASHVAGKLGLSKEETTKLVDEYKKVRESYSAAVRKAMEEAMASGVDTQDREAIRAAMREIQEKITKAETEKFAKALGAFLDKEKTEKAVTQLGSFSGSLDRMVNVIAGFKLDNAKQVEALDLINAYVVESSAARDKAMASDDFESMRTVFQELRTKLNEAMAKVLSAEQLAKWTEATARRGR